MTIQTSHSNYPNKEIEKACAWYAKEIGLIPKNTYDLQSALDSLHARADGKFGCDIASWGWKKYNNVL